MCFSDVLEGRSGSAAHTTNRKSFVFCGEVIRILTGLITAVIIVNVPLNLEVFRLKTDAGPLRALSRSVRRTYRTDL